MSPATRSGRTKLVWLCMTSAALLALAGCDTMPAIKLAVSMPAFGTLGITLGPGTAETLTNRASITLTNAAGATTLH